MPILDRLLGPFEAGRITLIDSSSDFVLQLTTLLCVRAVMEDADVVFVDGGNSVDPHGMVAFGKRAGLRREEILPRVHIARAFTCHQMATLILDTLDKKLEETDAGLVVLSCFPELFLDEDVERGEAHALFQRSMRGIRRTVASHEAIGLLTNVGPGKLYRRKSIRRQLYEGVDRVIRMGHGKGGVFIERPEAGVGEWYRPVAPDQTTLEDFIAGTPRILGLAPNRPPREVRTREPLRLAW